MEKSLLLTLDFPPRRGGVANYYLHLCENLEPKKLIVLAPRNKNAHNFDSQQNYKIYRKNLISKNLPWFKWLPIFWQIIYLILRERIKIIQVGQILPIGTAALIFKKILKVNYLVYVHGMDITLPLINSRRKKYLIKKILKNASYIISSNQFIKEKVLNLGVSRDKIIVVNPGPHLEDKINLTQVNFPLTWSSKKILLTVGRLIPRKGQDMVIKTLPEVLKKIPNLIYLIIGEGKNRKKLEYLTQKLNLKEKVIFLGEINDENLVAYYKKCDIFIMPSREIVDGDLEGFGMVYLEANLFGKPVIGGRSGGVSEAVIDHETGLLVDPNSKKEIARAIIKLLNDPNLMNKLGVQGKLRVLRDFNWSNQMEKIKNILK